MGIIDVSLVNCVSIVQVKISSEALQMLSDIPVTQTINLVCIFIRNVKLHCEITPRREM